ncbi:hypothetical protein B0T22DRAFT_16924 [Podospora appendiculata]|uniref:Uncharacterized protein n=1 Tax=Podospora appendiculata TaxID=314037 RepID=A0AAE1CFG3_9PEZI|nr:hypothetical protein B0T22DRAFT_16924 [Podospora appendiculata]
MEAQRLTCTAPSPDSTATDRGSKANIIVATDVGADAKKGLDQSKISPAAGENAHMSVSISAGNEQTDSEQNAHSSVSVSAGNKRQTLSKRYASAHFGRYRAEVPLIGASVSRLGGWRGCKCCPFRTWLDSDSSCTTFNHPQAGIADDLAGPRSKQWTKQLADRLEPGMTYEGPETFHVPAGGSPLPAAVIESGSVVGVLCDWAEHALQGFHEKPRIGMAWKSTTNRQAMVRALSRGLSRPTLLWRSWPWPTIHLSGTPGLGTWDWSTWY